MIDRTVVGCVLLICLVLGVFAGATASEQDRHEACGPGAGECFTANGTPGCEDVDCCETVCALDSWCCDNQWDSFCVTKAEENCDSGDPTGACCFYESCRDLTETDCANAGGVFQGFTDCTETTCSGGLATPERNSTDSGTIYLGAIADQDWGRPIASGDLDGDGYDEVIVAASESYGGVTSRVYIVRGGPGAHARGVIDLSSNGVDQVIIGAAADDNLGASIATGDLNADDIDDLVVCASLADYSSRADAGMAYVFFGGAGFFTSDTRDLSNASDWDVRVAGPVSAGDMGGAGSFGGMDAHAAAIGRLNNDAYGDLVLGVHLADSTVTDAGRVYAVWGYRLIAGTTLDLATSSGYDVVIYGDDIYDETGDYVLTGDITGDGLDELIIPNHYFSQYLFDSEGAVHIFRGRQSWGKTYNLGTTPADITLLGVEKYDELGTSAAVGDFNNDDILDLAAAAPGADVGVFTDQRGDGFVYGLLGSAAYQTGTHTIDYATATPDFLLVGEFEESLGAETAAADVNGDGWDDIIAVQRFGGPETNGIVEVLFGRNFSGNPVYTAGVSTDVRIVGEAQDRIGFSLGTADVDSNGVAEVLFGTPFNNGSYPDQAGTVYVFALYRGDYDGDGDVDLIDFAAFAACLAGPGCPTPPGGCPAGQFEASDLDADDDVDLFDFAAFQNAFTG